jgi:hypothetical protein
MSSEAPKLRIKPEYNEENNFTIVIQFFDTSLTIFRNIFSKKGFVGQF